MERTWPALQLPPWPAMRGPLTALSVVCLFAMWAWIGLRPWENDAWHFWAAWHDGRLYADAYRPVSEYPYSPAWAAAFWPLTQLPWGVAHAIWTAVQLIALTWMLGPILAVAAILFPLPTLPGYGGPVLATLENGNPQILTAAAIVAGMRWPGFWAYVLLSKASAGVGIAYFLVRREWRAAGIALGVTAAIVIVSALFNPGLWLEWLNYLYEAAFFAQSGEVMAKEHFMPLPLVVRGPIGLAVVGLAGYRGWTWLVPVGCFLALPDIQLGGYAVLTAAVALALRRVHTTQRVRLGSAAHQQTY